MQNLKFGWLFDPAVLVDDDGTGYLYFGGIGNTDGKKEDFIRNPKCARVVKLSDDMTSVDGDAKTIDAPFMFEDSGITKSEISIITVTAQTGPEALTVLPLTVQTARRQTLR